MHCTSANSTVERESMKRKTSRNLWLVGIVVYFVGLILFFGPGGVFALATGLGTVGDVGSSGFGALQLVAILAQVVGFILMLVGWIGALNTLSRLKQWAWFTLVLLIGGAMLVYIFVGPTEPKAAV
jgi:hypothetical protein